MPQPFESLPSNTLLETHSNSKGKALPATIFQPFNSHSLRNFLFRYFIQHFSSELLLHTQQNGYIHNTFFCISGTLSTKCFADWLGKSSLLFAILLQCETSNSFSSRSGNNQSKQMIKKNHCNGIKHKKEKNYTSWLEFKDFFNTLMLFYSSFNTASTLVILKSSIE